MCAMTMRFCKDVIKCRGAPSSCTCMLEGRMLPVAQVTGYKLGSAWPVLRGGESFNVNCCTQDGRISLAV